MRVLAAFWVALITWLLFDIRQTLDETLSEISGRLDVWEECEIYHDCDRMEPI